MWMSYLQAETRELTFPYKSLSPTLKKIITYDEDELWTEVDRIIDESHKNKYTPGQNLYYNLILCSDSSYWFDQDTNILLEEYTAIKRFNIPLATSIDDADYERLVIHSAIDEEYNALTNLKEDGKK